MGKRKKEKKLRKLVKKLKKFIDYSESNSDSADGGSEAGSEDDGEQHQVIEKEPVAEPGTQLVQDQLEIDSEVLTAMGAIEMEVETGPSVHSEITTRLTLIITKGLKKEEKYDLMKKYLPFENLPAMIPPKLNPELCAGVTEAVRKRDTLIQERQRQTSAALAALGTALQLSLTRGNTIEIIKCVNEAAKLLSDSLHTDTHNRRQLLAGVINKDFKEALQGDPDVWLFGNNLCERIKTTKTIQKSGQDLKTTPTFKGKPNRTTFKKALNWWGPPRLSTNRPAMTGGRSLKKQGAASEKKSSKPRHRR